MGVWEGKMIEEGEKEKGKVGPILAGWVGKREGRVWSGEEMTREVRETV